MTSSQSWRNIFLVHREDTEINGGHMARRPRSEAQANLVHTPSVTLQAPGLQSLEAPSAGSLHGALICLIAQRGGGHAAPWSNCWRKSTQMSGSSWRTPEREGSSLCLIWRCCTRWAHLLSPWWEGHLSNGSASAQVSGLFGTSIYSYDPEQSRSVVSTLWDPMDCSLPHSSIHVIFQSRVLEWVPIYFSRGPS